jgi:hypothetical protein
MLSGFLDWTLRTESVPLFWDWLFWSIHASASAETVISPVGQVVSIVQL